MSKTSKIVLWVIVVIVVIGGIVWFVMGQNSAAPAGQGYSAPTSQNNPASPTSPTSATGNTSGGLSTAPADNSNAALSQDLASIDAQMTGLTSDSASIDQGLNDQPVAQGQ